MSQVYVRSEQLVDKIYDVKLFIPEWKVLFAVDGKMDAAELGRFLELEQAEVNQALGHLAELGLLKTVGAEAGESPAEKAPTAEELFEAPEEAVTKEEIIEEVFEEEILETTEEEMPEEEVAEEEASEEPAEAAKEEAPTAAEETPEEMEELKLEEESADAAEKEDLDQLINDLLKEEESGADAEATMEFLEEEPEPPQETPEEAAAAEPEAPAETEEQEEQEEQFELGDIFESDIKETEQSLDEMLETMEEEEEEEEVAEAEAPPAPPAMEETAQKTILVVDDSVVIRKMVEIALENENYNIVSVGNGKEALTFLDENNPNLVILDIMLPDVNGLDILKAIKANKDIPVVMLSAKDTPRETSKARELGADDFIPKPFKDEELVGKIHELIGE